jgi:alcohol dehydrogenase class IV
MKLNLNDPFNFLPVTTNTHFGFGTLRRLPEHVKDLGGKIAFVVTDPGLRETGIVVKVERLLSDAGIKFSTYYEVKPDSGSNLINEATDQLRVSGANVVVGVGGGSSLDTAKAVAAMAVAPKPLLDYVGLGKLTHKPLPTIAIPTTAGTGSEVSLWSVFTDDDTKLKVAIGSLLLYPDVAICDPELTLGLPIALTAATGMDALTHAIECYTNNACQPISASLALTAVELIGRHLRSAVLNGRNRESRYAMLLASTMAGMAMNPTRLGLAHALAMPLGSWSLQIPHGVGNAITLPTVMNFNYPAEPGRFAEIAKALGERVEGMTELEAAGRSVEAVRTLARDIGIPRGLEKLGLKADHIPQVAEEAMKSGNVVVNPRQARVDDIKRILEESL